MFESIKQAVTVVRSTIDGVDKFNEPAYVFNEETVEGCLCFPNTAEALDDEGRPSGAYLKWTIAIPKSYTAPLRGCAVVMDDVLYRVVGEPLAAPSCPTDYDRIVTVEAYHG